MSDSAKVVAVVGASGFVGSAVALALSKRGHEVQAVKAPRVPPVSPSSAAAYVESEPEPLRSLTAAFKGVNCVVNAAGVSDATSTEVGELMAANGVLPGLIALASARSGAERFVHVSSAAVQGRLPVLDDSDTVDVFSDYSRSKLLGEQMVRRFAASGVIYRPAGVHGADRRVTRAVASVARSSFASVAKPASSPSPQALIGNVADAIAFLATTPLTPPPVVIHPWEGLTTGDVMTLLGGRRPIELPAAAATTVARSLSRAGRAAPRVAGMARRLDMLWFGQRQADSWMSAAGWSPPFGREEWQEIGRIIRLQSRQRQAK